jgi:CNP1-like family.
VGNALVRYTLVARSPQGPSNISYEGLDCAQDRWHIYGIWSAGTQRWIPNTSTEWRLVNAGGFTRIHAVLDSDDLCREQLAAGSVADIVARLKQGMRTSQPSP